VGAPRPARWVRREGEQAQLSQEATTRTGEDRARDDRPPSPGGPYAAPPSGDHGPAQGSPELQVSRRVDDEPARGAPGAAAADDRLGMEEIMERLAEELEAEYVRTYGSSGG
jgi:hypothetical protein